MASSGGKKGGKMAGLRNSRSKKGGGAGFMSGGKFVYRGSGG